MRCVVDDRGSIRDDAQARVVDAHLAALHGPTTLRQVKRVANKSERWGRGQRLRLEREDERAIVEWQAQAARVAQAIVRAHPGLQDVIEQSELLPGPTPSSLLLSNVSKRRGVVASRLASVCEELHTKTNLKTVLDHDWVLKHELVRGCEDAAGGGEGQPPAGAWSCFALGFCVCHDGPNAQLTHLHLRLHAALKLKFPFRSADWKELLKASEIVLELVGVHKDSGPDSDAVKSIVAHIGLQYLSPFRPTFRLLEKLSEDAARGIIIARSTSQFMVEGRFLRTLDLELVWTIIVWEIRKSLLPVVPFDPSKVTCVRIPTAAVGGQHLWPPPRSRKRGRSDDADGGPYGPISDDALVAAASGLPDDDANDDIVGADRAEEALEAAAALDHAIHLLLGEDPEGEEVDAVVAARLCSSSSSNSSSTSSSSSTTGSSSNTSSSGDDTEVAATSHGGSDMGGCGGGHVSDVESSDEDMNIELRADASLRAPGGVVRWYQHNMCFTTTCEDPRHAVGPTRCVLTRSSTQYANEAQRPHQGRPLGLIVGWLALDCDSKAEHWTRARWPDHIARGVARASIVGTRAGRRMLRRERPQRDDEDAEPVGFA